MCRDLQVARAVFAGVPKDTPVFGLAGTYMEQAAVELGLPFWTEFFGDVKYREDGSLVIDRKKKPWALEDVRAHVTQQLEDSSVTAVTGTVVPLPVKEYPISICCHSDSPGCVEIVKVTREVVDKFNKAQGYS